MAERLVLTLKTKGRPAEAVATVIDPKANVTTLRVKILVNEPRPG